MRRIPGRSARYQWVGSAMPLRGYFLFVGTALLALLFVVNAVLPPLAMDGSDSSEPRRPNIRIYSEHQGSQAVIIDTEQPIMVPKAAAQVDATAALQPFVPSDSHVRESLAQMVPPQAGVSETKNAVQKLPLKRRITKARTRRRPVQAARPVSFGLFDGDW